MIRSPSNRPNYSATLFVCIGVIAEVIVALPTLATAQGTKADYHRAAELSQLTANKVFRDVVEPHWLADGNSFWYRVRTGANTHEYIFVDAEKGTRQAAFDHEKLAQELKEAGVQDATADRLNLEQLQFDAAKHLTTFVRGGQTWGFDATSHKLSRTKSLGRATEPDKKPKPDDSPDPSNDTNDKKPQMVETSITFINKTVGEIEIFWMPDEKGRTSYGRLKPGEEHSQHTFVGHRWLVTDKEGKPLATTAGQEKPASLVVDGKNPPPNIADAEIRPRRRGTAPERPRSPDGKWTASIQEFNVVVKDGKSGEEHRLSTDGTADDPYDGRFFWSPDSKKLIALRTKPGQEHKVYLIESSPRDQVQPKLLSHDYLKPGDELPRPRPRLFDISELKQVPVNDELFANPWSIDQFRWEADSTRFSFLFNERGHQALRIVGIDAKTSQTSTIIDENSQTFIDYSGKMYLRWLDESSEIIWMSERDGWNHLYLYDATNGQVKNQITTGNWVVRSVDLVDSKSRQIWFRAGGIYPQQDPYYVHFARVNFDGSGLTILTGGNGTHKISYSPDQRYFLDTYSRVDQPPVNELRRTSDGKLVCELERADMSALLKTGWQPAEPFVAKARDGQTDIYGVILRPLNFDATKKYPIIEQIYAGPQDAYVPKSFNVNDKARQLAELGFVIVKIDGMGTSQRSKAFHDVCWKNLGDAGLPDRILWIKAAAEKYPYLDLSRVGIYGGSAGGQNSLGAMLTHGDFYKACVSDCGCHDNRMDKIWWNEQWMGWPIGPHYQAQSNVTLAHNLQGKLLLIFGEVDHNVDPASTMQVVNALVKANKDFDLLIIPGSDHGAAESPYGQRRRADFFVRHLLGVEPRGT